MTKRSPPFKAALSFPNGTIAYYCSQIARQKQVLQHIHEVLPKPLAEHALHCVVSGKKLLLYTDTAAWASQLRFYNRAILEAIAPITRESVSVMQIKVRAETSPAGRKREADEGAFQAMPHGRKPNIPSAEKIAFIHSHSLTVQDERLKAALLKLSATLANLSKR